MAHERIGSMNDFAAEHGIDPRSKEAELGYTALLTENYLRIRSEETAPSLPTGNVIQNDTANGEVQK